MALTIRAMRNNLGTSISPYYAPALCKLASPRNRHSFRHPFAAHLIENGYDIRAFHELLGHSDMKTTILHISRRRFALAQNTS